MIQKDRVPQMHASIKTVAFRGIDTIPVEVQVHVANGLPAMAGRFWKRPLRHNRCRRAGFTGF